jgi:adenylate kinase family enzyme
VRLVIVGTSGSGKTTLARKLSAALGLPQIELDAINWQAGWHDIATHDPVAFVRQAGAAAQGETWVADGNYTKARAVLWPRATAFIWMDYERPVVMRRVLWRSFSRAVSQRELWPGTGNREDFRRWLDREHPIRWAWDHWALNRRRYGEAFAGGAYEGRTVHRLAHPRDADALVARLTAQALSI